MKRGPNEFRCPVCGTSLSPNARSCGRCGSRREGSDWFGPESYDGLDLGEDDFDYDEFLRREFGGKGGRGGNWFTRMTAKERFWWLVAVVLLSAFVAMSLAGW